MNVLPVLIHALSPLHAGTGDAADIIDLPLARLKATGIPIVPGSSIKGVLRDYRREIDRDANRLDAVFGPSSTEAGLHAGALVVGDARLLALPVRSLRGVFAWVTSPLLLTFARRDLCHVGVTLPLPTVSRGKAAVAADSHCEVEHKGKVYLEDLDLPVVGSPEVAQWAKWLARQTYPDADILTRRFTVVDDDMMAFLWKTATQVDARVRIDEETRTVARGALWLEESLPPETLLLGLLAADRSRRQGVPMGPEEVLRFVLPGELFIQFGGKATTGHGRCRLLPIEGGL